MTLPPTTGEYAAIDTTRLRQEQTVQHQDLSGDGPLPPLTAHPRQTIPFLGNEARAEATAFSASPRYSDAAPAPFGIPAEYARGGRAEPLGETLRAYAWGEPSFGSSPALTGPLWGEQPSLVTPTSGDLLHPLHPSAAEPETPARAHTPEAATRARLTDALAELMAPEIRERRMWEAAELIADLCLEHDEALWAKPLSEALRWPSLSLVILLDTLTDRGLQSTAPALRSALIKLLQHEEDPVFSAALHVLMQGAEPASKEARRLREQLPPSCEARFDAALARMERAREYEAPPRLDSIWSALGALSGPLLDEDELRDHAEQIAAACARPDGERWVRQLALGLGSIQVREHLVTLLDALMDYRVRSEAPELRDALLRLLKHERDTVFHATLCVLLRCTTWPLEEARSLRAALNPERQRILDAVLKRVEAERSSRGGATEPLSETLRTCAAEPETPARPHTPEAATRASMNDALAELMASEIRERRMWEVAEFIADLCWENDEALWAEPLSEALRGSWARLPLVILLDTLTDYGVRSTAPALREALIALLQHEERTVFFSALYVLMYGVEETRASAQQLRDMLPPARYALFDACWSRMEEEGTLPQE